MKNKIILIISLLNYLCVYTHNSITTLKLIGANIDKYELELDNKVLIKRLKNKNVISKKINEPTQVKIINLKDTNAIKNQNVNYINFYLDIGTHVVTINLDESTITSSTSKLNTEYNEFLQLKKKYDTLFELNNKLDSIQLVKFGFINHNSSDSIKNEYHSDYFKKCLSIPNSFISLKFLKFIAENYFYVGLTKQDVLELYNNIGSNLKRYISYLNLKKYINNNLIKDNTKNDTINKPLWIPK